MKPNQKILIIPGFLEFAWLPRFFMLRREISKQIPGAVVKVMNFRWVRQPLSECSIKAQSRIASFKPDVVIGHSYGSEIAVRALAGTNKEYRPKLLLLCSPSNNWAEDVREGKSDWHPKFVRADILDNFSLVELAGSIKCHVEVLAAKPEMKDKAFSERVKYVAKILTAKKPTIVNSKRRHHNNFADAQYRAAIVKTLASS